MTIRSSTARSIRGLAAFLLAFGPIAPAVAQVEVTETDVTVEEEDTEKDASRWSGALQFDFTNAYFFRGYLNERSDFIWQPWAELNLNLFSSDDGFIRDITVGFGVWNSVHQDKTFAEHSPDALYETDWYPMVAIGLPGDVTFTTYYYWYTSPNGAFDTVQELDLRFDWDDTEYSKDLPLAPFNPYVNLAIETDRSSNPNTGDQGVGLQMGFEPLLYEFDNKDFPLAFTAPIELGLSIDDYYTNESGSNRGFGYISYGVAATLPLAFLDSSWGDVSLGFSAKGLHLDNELANINHNDDNYGVVMASIGFEF